MSENSQLPVVFNDAQRDIVLMQTPPGEIKQRPGRGGKPVNYVEIGYVVETLNRAFGFDWDFEVVQHSFLAEANEVCVLGRLTVRANGYAIVKQQFGGSGVKFLKGSKTPVSLADDFKAAASDALKKCASLIGIAHDVYRGEVSVPNSVETEPTPKRQAAPKRKPAPKKAAATGHWIDDDTTCKRFWAYVKDDLGLTEEQVHTGLNVAHIRDFPGTKKEVAAILQEIASKLPFFEPSEMEY